MQNYLLKSTTSPIETELENGTSEPYQNTNSRTSGDADVVSVGVLCFAIVESTRDIFFLLGKECAGYGSAGRWSDFGGTREQGETFQECGAREFVEESMGVVQVCYPFQCPFVKTKTIQSMLENDEHSLRITVNSDRYSSRDSCQRGAAPTTFSRVCYLKQIPWQPDLPERFSQIRQDMDNLRNKLHYSKEEAIKFYSLMSPELQLHPCIKLERDPENGKILDLQVDGHFFEKQQIYWWSFDRLLQIVRGDGIFHNKLCFRKGFSSILNIVLNHMESLMTPTRRF